MIKNNLNPLAGFSAITFHAYGREIRVIVEETQNFAFLQAGGGEVTHKL